MGLNKMQLHILIYIQKNIDAKIKTNKKAKFSVICSVSNLKQEGEKVHVAAGKWKVKSKQGESPDTICCKILDIIKIQSKAILQPDK